MESLQEFKSVEAETVKKRPWYAINTYTLPCKVGFITAHMAFGSYIPNAGVFLTSIGLSKSQTGIIGGVRTLAEIIGNPVWGAVADKTRAPKWVLMVLIVMSLCLVAPQPWIAHSVEPVQKHQVCTNTTPEHSQNVSALSTTPSGTATPSDPPPTNDTYRIKCEMVSKPASSKLFYTMLAVVPLSYIFAGSLPNAVETRVLKVVQSSPVPATFGQQRYFGSASFGISSVIAGLLADNIQFQGMSSYTAFAFWYIPGLVLLGVVALTLLFKADVQSHEPQKNDDVNVSKLVLSTLKQVDVIFFFLTVLVTGIASGVLYGFLFIYLEELHASKFEMGLNILLSCAVELLVFPFSTPIIRFVRGNRCAMAIGLFMYLPRFLMVSYFKNIWLILSSHALHGLCFALFWAAAVDYIYQVCPKAILTTMLGILNAIYSGVGQLIANFLGGFLYEEFGGHALYLIAAIACVIWSVIWSVYIAISFRRRSRRGQIQESK